LGSVVPPGVLVFGSGEVVPLDEAVTVSRGSSTLKTGSFWLEASAMKSSFSRVVQVWENRSPCCL
jgi:hypothetical protein